MHTFCLITSLFIALPSAFAYQAEGKASGPMMVFEEKNHDFGTIRKGEKKDIVFKFKNEGDATLKIQSVRADCGCTTPNLTKKSFEPGESGEIPVTLDSTTLSGDVHKNVYVYSNDRNGEKIQLHLDAQIFTPIMVEPANVAMNRVPRAGLQKGSLRISTTFLDKLEVTNPTSNLPYVSVNAERVDEKTVDLHFSFKGEDVPQGNSRIVGMVSFDTNSADQPTVSARLVIRMLDIVSFKPRLVTFIGNDMEPKTITLESAKPDMDLAIESFEVDHPGLSLEKVEGQPLQIKVRLNDKAPAGSFRGNVTIKTNALEQPRIIVPVRIRR